MRKRPRARYLRGPLKQGELGQKVPPPFRPPSIPFPVPVDVLMPKVAPLFVDGERVDATLQRAVVPLGVTEFLPWLGRLSHLVSAQARWPEPRLLKHIVEVVVSHPSHPAQARESGA